MSKQALKVVSIVIVIVGINAWSRTGNMNELLRENGINLLQYFFLLFLIGVAGLLIWNRRVKIWQFLAIGTLVVPSISYLLGNTFGLAPKFFIVYPVISMTMLIIFRKELLRAL